MKYLERVIIKMIVNTKRIKLQSINKEDVLVVDNKSSVYRESVFLDLEHYVYKKPVCIGIFGVCIYDFHTNSLILTQFMMENHKDEDKILYNAYKYLKKCKVKLKKKYLVTFSGNNDYLVIEHLFKEKKIPLNIRTYFKEIDLQKEYEKVKKESIGLKNLEKIFNIHREGDVISGLKLAKIIKNINGYEEYLENVSEDKIENLLLYNEQDVINLFNILINWNKYIM